MKRNGAYLLLVQTCHGALAFRNQKFFCPQQGSRAFLQARHDGQSAVTRGLHSLAVLTCLDAQSYEKARQALARVTGVSWLTRQTLCNWVQKAAAHLDKSLKAQAQQRADRLLPPLADTVDVYDPQTSEVNSFADGILVKAQKPTHEPQGEAKQAKPCQFHQSYFGLAPRRDGSYAFALASTDGTVGLSGALRTFVCQHWQDAPEALALVAITDGARDLRQILGAAFGEQGVIVLDWFHLRKKVCECASMRVSTKQARTQLKKQLLGLVFAGQVRAALQVVASLPVRNALLHTKLMAYLTNHAHEIPDYGRRARAGKTIGSGRMEKGVDQVIGVRQKDQGMSWSQRGSYALGILTAYRANGHWDQLWNTSEMKA